MLRTSEDGISISSRFFQALEILTDMGYVRGLQTFTRDHGLSYGHFNTIRSKKDSRTVKVEYLTYLARDYNVSCEWLLLGVGDMFAKGGPRRKVHVPTHKTSKSEESQSP